MCIIFGESYDGIPAIDFKVCGMKRGAIRTTAGFNIDVRFGLTALKTAELIIVPSRHDLTTRPPAPLLAALITAQRRGALIVGLCL